MNLTLLLTIIILVICILLLGVRIFFVKGGKFPETHVAGNKALTKNGVSCSKSQDKEERERKNLFERLKESENKKE